MSLNRREQIRTSRLLLRKPLIVDAKAIFTRYASDSDVTRYLGWPMHRTIDDTIAFINFSNQEWQEWSAGPYVIELLADSTIIGSTGLKFESPNYALTGYALAKDAWGFGYATEALKAMIELAVELDVHLLYGLCHPENHASKNVLKKCGFTLENKLQIPGAYPNLKSDDGTTHRFSKTLKTD